MKPALPNSDLLDDYDSEKESNENNRAMTDEGSLSQAARDDVLVVSPDGIQPNSPSLCSETIGDGPAAPHGGSAESVGCLSQGAVNDLKTLLQVKSVLGQRSLPIEVNRADARHGFVTFAVLNWHLYIQVQSAADGISSSSTEPYGGMQ